jgi:predicted RNase H-like nuclease (RuvC/YqgF family)
LEGELEEVQDNFREDEMDEFRTLKRDLENQAKNVRVLQFKLKKAERTITEMIAEKADLESKLKGTGGSSGVGSDASRIRQLEKELEQKTQLNAKYEQQITELKGGSKLGGLKRGGTGPVLSRYEPIFKVKHEEKT